VLASFRANVPQLTVEVDRVKTQTLGVSLDQVFAALSGYLGSSYVDQFNKFGPVGITVFTGMIASTCLAVLFVPPFFVMVQRFEEWLKVRKGPYLAGTSVG
jgi:multidrug efflux pump subunit AcrB